MTSRRLPLILVALLAAPRGLQACSVCYGDPDADMTRGALWGVAALGAIVYSVIFGMFCVGISWFRRARRLQALGSGFPTD